MSSTRLTAPSWVGVTIGLGATLLAVALALRVEAPLETLALLAAAAVLTELLQVPSDETSSEPGDAHSLSFSSGVHLATVLVVGPWTAALIAAFGVITVDRLRGIGWRHVAYNASVFALAAGAGGLAFILVGGSPGAVPALPADFVPLLALACTYYAVNYGFQSAVVAFEGGERFWPLAREASADGFAPAVAETGLAFASAHFVLTEPWALVALAPLVLAAYHASERLARLRRETARALETFANVVDERDESTFRHSARVAADVEGFATALGAPGWAAGRLRWAGRLHDLGKIAVDAVVLRKPGRLDEDEWAALLRHPRLSARLLRGFRFAAPAARAVEHHHERYDGRGYYGMEADDIPLAAHVLVVADSFDAMTSDRSYRKGMPASRALAEIEAGAGQQFHPQIARAYVAFKRGLDPRTLLSSEELAALLRGLGERRALPRLRVDSRSAVLATTGLGAALLALGAGVPVLAVPGAAVCACVLALRRLDARKVRGARKAVEAALEQAGGSDVGFAAVRAALAERFSLTWIAIVRWDERELTAAVEQCWARGVEAPSELALTSWLVREAESGGAILVDEERSRGANARVAVPLHAEDRTVAGWLVAGCAARPQPLAAALADVNDALSLRLAPGRAESRPGEEPRRLSAVAS